MPASPSRRGSAMVMAAVLVVILGGIAISLTETTVSSLKGEHRRADDLALAMAAESSANIAIEYLQRHSDMLRTDLKTEAEKKAVLPSMEELEAGKSTAELGAATGIRVVAGMGIGSRWCYVGQRAVIKTYVDGLPRLEIVAPGTADSMLQDVYFVRAWATQGSAADVATWRTRRVEMLFVPYPQEVFVRAMFASRGYDFQGDAKTNSWDSATGPYDPATPGKKGDLGSEGDIYVQKPSNVQGKVDDFINYPLPPIEFDDSLAYESPDVLKASTTLTAGTYRFAAIDLHEPEQLTITGAVKIYVDGPVSLSGGKKFNPLVYTDATSKLTIVQNDYDPAAHPEWSGISNGIDTVNGTESIGDPTMPSRFIYVSAFHGEMTFNGNGVFGGVLYVPNATLKLNGTFDFFGSVIANAFASKALTGEAEQGKVNGTFSFHFDEQLAKLALPLPARLGVVGWFTTGPRFGGP